MRTGRARLVSDNFVHAWRRSSVTAIGLLVALGRSTPAQVAKPGQCQVPRSRFMEAASC
jgi:hypothetical protein